MSSWERRNPGCKVYEEWQRLYKAASDADTEADLRHNAVRELLPPRPQPLSVTAAKEGTPDWDRFLAAMERGRTLKERLQELHKEDEKAQQKWRAECEPIYEREGVSELELKDGKCRSI